jgi:hypothetical protein
MEIRTKLKPLIASIPKLLITISAGILISVVVPLLAYGGKFGFPDVSDKIGVLIDQLPQYMTDEQVRFAARHYLGSQKLPLSLTKRLRKYNRNFVVLHYHLGIWQQQPNHQFIIDGQRWGNDWDEVARHENWFWHNERGERVRSSHDGKYLMNIMEPTFQEYWKSSILKQLQAGAYQAVFLDSSSVDSLQWEVSKVDSRLAGMSARGRTFPELGGRTWSKAYELFMKELTDSLERGGFAALPNIGAQITTWDNTDYFTTSSGAFMENAFMTRSAEDWKMAARRTIELIGREKIVLFQPYLKHDSDIEARIYYLACYLLLKGEYSYICYFARSHLSWYPEFNVQLGSPLQRIIRLEDIQVEDGLYRRKFVKGEVWVNPTGEPKRVRLDGSYWKVIPEGGGPVNRADTEPGKLRYEKVSEVVLPRWSGTVLLRNP